MVENCSAEFVISAVSCRMGALPSWDSCTETVRDEVVEEVSEGWRGAPGGTVCVCVCVCVCIGMHT